MVDEVEIRLHARIRPHLRYLEDGDELGNDADLDALGLDSTAAMSLLLDIEEEFGLMFPEHLLTEETFATPDSLLEVVRRLLG